MSLHNVVAMICKGCNGVHHTHHTQVMPQVMYTVTHVKYTAYYSTSTQKTAREYTGIVSYVYH